MSETVAASYFSHSGSSVHCEGKEGLGTWPGTWCSERHRVPAVSGAPPLSPSFPSGTGPRACDPAAWTPPSFVRRVSLKVCIGLGEGRKLSSQTSCGILIL
jgi:hypothetical protein